MRQLRHWEHWDNETLRTLRHWDNETLRQWDNETMRFDVERWQWSEILHIQTEFFKERQIEPLGSDTHQRVAIVSQ